MNIVTATMAKNIATDYENNAWGPVLDSIMDVILKKAIRGERSCHVSIPLDQFSLEGAMSTMTFFKGLGYKVSGWGMDDNLYYDLKW